MATYFAAILCGRWQGRRDFVPWVTAAIASLIAANLLAPGWHIIAGALAGGLAGALAHGD